MKETIGELRAGQDTVLTPDGAFKIALKDRPRHYGTYRLRYHPFDQFISEVEEVLPVAAPETGPFTPNGR